MTLGIDEVGRGAWAGPFLVCGVLGLSANLSDLRDSKTLSSQKREELSVAIKQNSIAIELVWISAERLDDIGLTAAMKFACLKIFSSFSKENFITIIDGNQNFLSNEENTSALIKADQSVPEVSAASIVAKVARDNYMQKIGVKHPDYAFEFHVGYGTASHKDKLESFGAIEGIHRKSFKPVKDIFEQFYEHRKVGRGSGGSALDTTRLEA